MGKINISRWILGGIVAGIAFDLLGYWVDGVLLAPRWARDMAQLGRPAITTRQIFWFEAIGMATGLLAIWVYAAIRPRFGAGGRTAICAGIAVWVATALLPNLSMMYVSGLFSHHLTVYTTAGGLIEIVVATVAGAAVYREAGGAEAGAAAGQPRQTARA